MFVQKTENGKKLFFRNSILTMMSKEEHQAMKTCFNKVHMRFHANQQWNQRRKEHLPCSFHMNTDFLMTTTQHDGQPISMPNKRLKSVKLVPTS